MRRYGAVFAAGLAFVVLAGGASAQEDLEKGKSGAELFAKDCAICHKTPQAVVKGGSPGEGFLRQHYTSGSQTAAILAAYLRGIQPPAERAARPKPKAKPAGAKPKAAEDAKPASESKPADMKVSEPKAKPSKKKASEKKDQPADKKE